MRSLLVFDSSVMAVAQSDFVTHVARAVSTKSNGAHIEKSESTLDVAPKTTSSASANPTASGNSTGLAGVTGVDKISPPGPGWQGWQGCSTGQKTSILDGLCEAHTVLGTRGVCYIDYHWNDFATVEDLGSTRERKRAAWDLTDQGSRRAKRERAGFSRERRER